MTPDAFHAFALAAADEEGRLPLSRMAWWEVFPFEPEGLRTVPLAAPVLPEPPRHGEGGRPCEACADDAPWVWRDERWRLRVLDGSGAPLLLMLGPVAHHDLVDLPDDLAGELGRLVVHVARAVEALPGIARCHVSRWGDGGAHLHVFLYARPEGFSQLRGTCLALWDDLLPPLPPVVRYGDARAVAEALVSALGGEAAPPGVVWDAHYSVSERVWSGHPNGALVAEAEGLAPGRVLDVGCGEGADAVWLAQRGWQVTGLDVTEVALERARAAAADAGVAVEWVHGGVVEARPTGYDLVSAMYPAIPRSDAAVRALLDAVAVGGTLLVVHHDVDPEHARSRGFDPAGFVMPADVAAALDDDWAVEVDERRERQVPQSGGGSGNHAPDVVLRARRLR